MKVYRTLYEVEMCEDTTLPDFVEMGEEIGEWQVDDPDHWFDSVPPIGVKISADLFTPEVDDPYWI